MPLESIKPGSDQSAEFKKPVKGDKGVGQQQNLMSSGGAEGSKDTKEVKAPDSSPITAESYNEGFKDFLRRQGLSVKDDPESETGPQHEVSGDSKVPQISVTGSEPQERLFSFNDQLKPPIVGSDRDSVASGRSKVGSTKSDLSEDLRAMLFPRMDDAIKPSNVSIRSLGRAIDIGDNNEDNQSQQHLGVYTPSIRSTHVSDQQLFYSQRDQSSAKLSEISTDSDVSVYSYYQAYDKRRITVTHPAKEFTMSREDTVQQLEKVG